MKHLQTYEKKTTVNDVELVIAAGDRNSTIEYIKTLIDYGININSRGALHQTPLIRATISNNLEVVKVLVEAGVKLNLRDMKGATALIYSAEHGSGTGPGKILEYLIEKGADLNIKDNENDTAILMAAWHHEFENAYRLIQAGADPFIRSNNGDTFFDELESMGTDEVEYFKERFPEIWKEYILRKEMDKYNL